MIIDQLPITAVRNPASHHPIGVVTGRVTGWGGLFPSHRQYLQGDYPANTVQGHTALLGSRPSRLAPPGPSHQSPSSPPRDSRRPKNAQPPGRLSLPRLPGSASPTRYTRLPSRSPSHRPERATTPALPSLLHLHLCSEHPHCPPRLHRRPTAHSPHLIPGS